LGKIKLVVIFLFLSFSSGQTILKILEENNKELIFEFSLTEYQLHPTYYQGKKYHRVSIKEAVVETKAGYPQIPFLKLTIGVPEKATLRPQILELTQTTISSVVLLPAGQEVVRKTSTGLLKIEKIFCLDQQLYQQDDFYPPSLVKIEPRGFLRDQKIAWVKVRLCQFNPVSQKIKIVERIKVKISFLPSPGQVSSASSFNSSQRGDPFFEGIYREILLNYEQAKKWRWRRNPCPSSKFTPPPGRWYKFKVPSPGLYRITFEQLVENQIPVAGVKVDQIRMYNNFHLLKECRLPISNLVSNRWMWESFYTLPQELLTSESPTENIYQIPPAEIAIYVEDNDRNSFFTAGDVIYFFGVGPDFSDPIQEKLHLSPYNQENIYWLTLEEPGPGKRMTTLSPPSAPQPLPTQSFSFFTSLRVLQFPFTRVEAHFSPFQFYWWNFPESEPTGGKELVLSFPAFFAPNTEVKLSFSFLKPPSSGGAGFKVNNQLLSKPEVEFSLPGRNTLTVKFPAHYLKPGENKISLILPQGSRQLLGVEIRGSVLYQAYQNQLFFLSPRSLPPGSYLFSVSNFTTNDEIMIFDLTDLAHPKRITQLITEVEGERKKIKFSDRSQGERKFYLAVAKDQLPAPAYVGVGDFSLTSPHQQADYLIITPPQFLSSPHLQTFIAHREKAYRVKVATTSQIYDSFSYGLIDPIALRNFINYAYRHWQKPAPAYVLLLGSASFSYRGELAEKNLIPTYYGNKRAAYFLTLPTDNWFACVQGKDNVADLLVGRLPASDEKELKIVLSRVIEYESLEKDLSWRDRIFLSGDDDEKPDRVRGDDRLFYTYLEVISEGYGKDVVSGELFRYIPSSYQPIKLYLKDYPRDYSAPWYGVVPAANEEFIRRFNQGYLVGVYTGHGGSNIMADECLFNTSSRNLSRLYNKPRYPIFLSFSCFNGAYDLPWNIGVKLTKEERGGTIAFIASSRLSSKGWNFQILKHFCRHFFYQRKNGKLELKAKRILGEAFLISKLGCLNQHYYESYNLIGDPGVILGDTQPPFFEAQVDGQRFSNMQYLLPGPERNIQITITDESGLEKVDIVKQGEKISNYQLVKDKETQFRIFYSPEIKKGNYQILVKARDKAENEGIFVFQVAEKLEIKGLMNSPNPFWDKTTISYFISQVPDKIAVKIYTITQRLVRKLEPVIFKNGYQQISWDGRDEEGIPVGNGVYLYKIIAEKEGEKAESEIEKMVRLW
jgi:hypothetical protein